MKITRKQVKAFLNSLKGRSSCRYFTTFAIVVLSLGYGSFILYLSDPSFSHFNSSSSIHQIQAKNLLNGHLYLGLTHNEMESGLVWYDGKVQHVWGLGVGMWLAIFEFLFNGKGTNYFPDRISIAVAFSLLFMLVIRTGNLLSGSGRTSEALLFIGIFLFVPQLFTLARCMNNIMDQTVLCSVVCCFFLIVSSCNFIWFKRKFDLVLLATCICVLPLFRPTFVAYSTLVTISLFVSLYRQQEKTACGILVMSFSAGIIFLLLTNAIRFGNSFEFGHNLTATTPEMTLLMRGKNPFLQAPPSSASQELFALLFSSPSILDNDALSENLFAQQAPFTRWRRLYCSAYAISDAYLFIFSILLLAMPRVRKARTTLTYGFMAIFPLLWAHVLVFISLFLFYLYYPVIASRYLFDFLPALSLSSFFTFAFLTTKMPKVSIFLFHLWLFSGYINSVAPFFDFGG